MISLPNFSEFTESVNADEEVNETNYCDQQPVTIEFSFEEHSFLNDILCHVSDELYLACPNLHEMPEDSEILQRFRMLEQMRGKSHTLWSQRFGN